MSEPAATPAAAPQTWQRRSMSQRLLRYALGLFIMAAIVQAAHTVEVIPEFLYDAPEQMGDMLYSDRKSVV